MKLINNKFIRLIVIPILLIFLWFFGSVLTDPYANTTTLEYPYTQSVYKIFPEGKLYKGKQIKGEFKARENNLGIISLKVKKRDLPFPALEEDMLRFRIKEKKNSQWYYENQYRIGAIKEKDFLVFGFPKITDSLGKEYIFEITSIRGDLNNALAFDSEYPSIYIRYIYSFKDAIKDRTVGILLLKKFHSMMIDKRALFYSLIFLLPFILYVSFLRLNAMLRSYLESAIILLIFLDIIQTKYEVYAFTLAILGIWILTIYRNRISHRYNLLLSFVCMVTAVFFQLVKLPEMADKSSMWGYYLLCISFCLLLLELKEKYQLLRKK